MNYEISLYHLIPWQRSTTLVQETFNVDETHVGVSRLWNHLRASGNREIRTETLNGGIIDLVRPVDCEYAFNWIFTTRHIKDIDKPVFAQAINQMMSDRWLWFGFRKVKQCSVHSTQQES